VTAPERPDAKTDLRLVVIGDSTAFTDARGPHLPSEAGLYPNVVRAALERALDRPVAVNVLARAGTHTRDAYRMVLKDRHAQFEVLMGADAVVVGVGSFDHAPAGVPATVESLVPLLRSRRLRRTARRALHAVHPWGVRLTRGRFARAPLGEWRRTYDGLLFQVRALTQGAAGVVMGPTSHRSAYYGDLHPLHAAREAEQRAIAERHGFPFVASWPLVEPFAARLNPDGIHWPAEAHAAVGEALAAPLVAQLTGATPKPSIPGLGERAG